MRLKRILRFIKNDFKKRVCNERGTWVAVAIAGAAVIGGGAAIGGSMISASSQDKATEEQRKNWEKQIEMMNIPPTWMQSPEYPEAEGARGSWWSKLQEWGGQPGYGAIAPNWNDIWGQAQKRVSDYWQGTATTPGAMDRIKSSVAARGVEDSPAFGTLASRASVEQGGQLKDLAVTQATTEAAFSEQGRQNWLTSLMNLSQQKPSGTWWSPGAGMATVQGNMPLTPQSGLGTSLSGLGAGLGEYSGNLMATQQQNKFWEEMMKKYGGGMGQTTQGSIVGNRGGDDWYGLSPKDLYEPTF